MEAAQSPRGVLARLLDGIAEQRWGTLHELYAEEATVEYPFSLPNPTRLEGRAAIATYFQSVAKFPLSLKPRDIVVHETADSEVVVAEWTYDGLVTTTGRTFVVANIQVSRVQGGKIVASRDYHNHFAMAEAAGGLPRLVAAVTAKSSN